MKSFVNDVYTAVFVLNHSQDSKGRFFDMVIKISVLFNSKTMLIQTEFRCSTRSEGVLELLSNVYVITPSKAVALNSQQTTTNMFSKEKGCYYPNWV